jgi:type I restriction enzyme S subunit
MRDGWVETTLGEVSESSWGNTEITKSKYVPTGFLAFSASGADGFLDWFEHDTSAVILSAIGAQCGKTWFASGKWTAIKNTIWLKSNGVSLSDRYLFYLSNTEHFWQIRGQAQPFISLGDVKKKKLILPPVAEQKRIVDLISSVDSYIEALQQQVDKARKSRNAVLHELLTKGGDGWVETTLGEVTTIINGGTPSTKNADYWGGEIVWITTTELTASDGKRVNSSKRTITQDGLNSGPARMVRAGTTLVGTTATIGTCAIAACDLTFNQQISGLLPKTNKIDDGFLFYWIQFAKPIFEGLAAGTSFKRISTSVLKTVEIKFPPLPEQKRIVDLISSVDSYIEALQQQVDKARKSRNAVLHELLTKGGDGWVETTLREICKNSLFSDGDWVESKDQDPEGEFRLIQLADIGSGCFLDKSNRWMNSEQFNRLSCTSLQKNDILIARMPDPIGRACLFPDNLPTSATVVDVAIIRTGNENLQKFLVTLINSTIFNAKIKSLVSGTTRQRISKSNLGAIQFMLPDPPEQKRIIEIISVFDNQIEALDSTIAKTQNLRSALLSDLLSGNHEIPTTYDKLIGAA